MLGAHARSFSSVATNSTHSGHPVNSKVASIIVVNCLKGLIVRRYFEMLLKTWFFHRNRFCFSQLLCKRIFPGHKEINEIINENDRLQRGGWKRQFLRCLWELNNFFLNAMSSALDLPMVPFDCTHILVLSDLKIWRPSNKMFETLENRPVGWKRHSWKS